MSKTPVAGLPRSGELNTSDWAGHPKGSPGYRRILLALACAGVATFAQLYSTQAVLPLMAEDLAVPASQAALTVSLATIGLAAAVLPWSFVADRIGRVRAMAIAIAAATILGLLVPLSPFFEAVLVLRFLEGAALGGIPAVAMAFLGEEVHKSHTAMAAGSYIAGTTLGGLSGRLLAGPVGEALGWRAATGAVAVMAATAALMFVLLVPRPQGFSPSRRAGLRPAMRALVGALRERRLLALYAQAFFLMGGFVAVYNYLGFHLERDPFGLPTTMVSLIFLAYLAGTVSSRWAAELTSRWGRRRVLTAGIAVMITGILLTTVPVLAAILTGLVIFTAGFFAAHGIGSGWTGDLAPAARAQAASLYNLAYYLGSSVLGWAGGLVYESFGWVWMAGGVAVLATVMAAVAVVAHR
ncbi:MFS transporter [Arthrobacter sp. M4]|uniref:MFS transporter n=1 Tax=Arthrobacter sp. M4 TaxID=218160 RepID=UPI0035AB7FF0